MYFGKLTLIPIKIGQKIRLKDFCQTVSRHLSKNVYSYFHILYFLLVILIGSVVIYSFEHRKYIDVLFTTVSAMTETGLDIVEFPSVTLNTQIVVFVLMEIGGIVILSAIPPLVRLLYYKSCMKPPQSDHKKELFQIYIKVCTLITTTIVLYWILLQVVPFLVYVFYFHISQHAADILESRKVNVWWFSAFFSASSFNNVGFSLTANSLMPFQHDGVIQCVSAIQIVAGNTLYPVFFRACMYISYSLWRLCNRHLSDEAKNKSTVFKSFNLVLKEPQHFCTHLYPFRETMILLATWLAITTVECGVFLKEWQSTSIYGFNATVGQKMLVIFYQTVSVRTAGFSSINISSLSIGHLTIYIVTMYVSTQPFVMNIQTGNMDNNKKSSKSYFQQAKRLAGWDILWLYFALVNICYYSNLSLQFDLDNGFVFLRLMFEISSAYGNVGLSIGAPRTNVAFSGMLSGAGKLVMMTIMFAGRHRGLPNCLALDIEISETALQEILQIKDPDSGQNGEVKSPRGLQLDDIP